MSDDEKWQIALRFQDQKSNKFWRARTSGNALEINYGRVGSNGQRQIKRYDSAEDSARELDKQAAAKRKKGYADDPDANLGAEPAAAAAPADADADAQCRLLLDLGERRIELLLSVADRELRTVAVERYASADDALTALERLREAMIDEGYRLKS